MTVKVLDIQCVWDAKALLGEGPLYDPRDETLLWIDIKAAKLFRLKIKSGEKTRWDLPEAISSLGLRRRGGYICTRADGFHELEIIDVERVEFRGIADPEIDKPYNRFNDGKVDPEGGYWAGTLEDAEADDTAGTWWRLGAEGGVTQMDKGYHVTNGPAFDVSRSRIYLTDSARQTIYIAKFENGTLSDKRVFKTFQAVEGCPDGITVDRYGYLWVCLWDGSCLHRLNPYGECVLEVDMPVARPTSLAFFGDTAFVTSASTGLSKSALRAAPLSGGLFKIRFDTALSSEDRFYGVF